MSDCGCGVSITAYNNADLAIDFDILENSAPMAGLETARFKLAVRNMSGRVYVEWTTEDSISFNATTAVGELRVPAATVATALPPDNYLFDLLLIRDTKTDVFAGGSLEIRRGVSHVD